MSNLLLNIERDIWIALAILCCGAGLGVLGTVTVLLWVR